MEHKETSIKTFDERELLQDAQFYKYIFKKTEKIVCAVFYILRNQDVLQKDTVTDELENVSKRLMQCAVTALSATSRTVREEASHIRYGLIELESYLRIAQAARLIEGEYLEVFVREIDSVQRSLREYTRISVLNPLVQDDDTSAAREPKVSTRKPSKQFVHIDKVGTSVQPTPVESRRERVLTVIKDKKEATIKDISDTIKDCSEKTIQRELISLIKDGIIVRDGERRWSKYRILI
jgi:hypothetical protein